MPRIPLLLLLALVPLAARQDGEDGLAGHPVSDLQRFELEVVHWEGTFGTYMHPGPGSSILVDLERVGSPELTSFPLGTGDGRFGHFALEFLEPVSDRVAGDPGRRVSRRVLLSGRRPDAGERTLLEVVILWEVASTLEVEGRSVPQSSDVTHVDLRLYTLRDDDTIREYARARTTLRRDG